MVKRILCLVLSLMFLLTGSWSQAIARSREIKLTMRSQILIQDEIGRNVWQMISYKKNIPASQIAIIICDVWDKHWSRGATVRLDEMAPRMNAIVKAARARGIQIIHAPSGCIRFYKGTPARKRIVKYRNPRNYNYRRENFITERQITLALMNKWGIDTELGGIKFDPCLWFSLRGGNSDTSNTDEVPNQMVWTREHPAIEIDQEKDVISDNEGEIYNFCRRKDIKYIALMGVHTNQCILYNYSFGIFPCLREK